MAISWQQPLPDIFLQLTDAELKIRIAAAKEALGKQLIILGHHYQQDDIIAFADYSGDSFELARKAQQQREARSVIFCGVHFMAESADILTDPSVQVILPDLGAGCSMADMANLDQTLDCWEQLTAVCPDQQLIPITYINSSAAIKSFVGEHGGAVCTSSNCQQILKWALAGGENPTGQRVKIIFLPDQHLGRNTAFAMGYPLEQMVLWDPRKDLGGNSAAALTAADFVLWKGHCSVHALFRPEHVDEVRQKYPGIRVMVHPECSREVVAKADASGSTAAIVKAVAAAPAGSKWAIGTEVHLVNRLRQLHPDQQIIVLSECQCLCTTMYRIDLPHLCWAIENLAQGNVVNRITVDDHTRKFATLGLQRMLDITAGGDPSLVRPVSPAAK